MDIKEERLAALLAARGCAKVELRRRANVAWLAGADVHVDSGSPLGVAAIVWSPSERVVVTDTIEAARLAEEEFGSGWSVVARPWWEPPPEPEDGCLRDWPVDAVASLRWSLTDEEIRDVRDLGSATVAVVEGFLRRVRPGTTECEAAGAVAGRLLALGIDPRVLLVAADGRIRRYRHPIPKATRLERTLMFVVCAQRKGLIVAFTRMLNFGELPADLRRRHDSVCAIDAALHAATRPGASYGAILDVARGLYEAHGFPDEWKLHHQGGPLGYELRDFCVVPGDARKVVERQLVAWNPSITGTKSEDTILSDGEVVTASGEWPVRGGRPDVLVRRAD